MDKKPNTRKAAADLVFNAASHADVENVLVNRDPRNPYAFVVRMGGEDFRVVVKPLAAKDSAD
jgi:D-alanine-D-alanine ligase-like ATP-grasp enzyme